jgi:osmotically-inducible protein OsmY
MPYSSRRFSPSVEAHGTLGLRPSLFDTKDEFIERVSPIGVAAIYFGGFSLSPQDPALSRQALFKLSFAHRNFLAPFGLRIFVDGSTAMFSGAVNSAHLPVLAEILAHQIEGIEDVKDATEKAPGAMAPLEKSRAAAQLLFATDQTLRSGLQLGISGDQLLLEGEAETAAQGAWAEQLAGSVGAPVQSRLQTPHIPNHALEAMRPPEVDDESLQALVLFRLRLVRETEHLPIKVKASRGIVTLQGKVRTEALRRKVENLTRSTMGLKELRSSLSIAA